MILLYSLGITPPVLPGSLGRTDAHKSARPEALSPSLRFLLYKKVSGNGRSMEITIDSSTMDNRRRCPKDYGNLLSGCIDTPSRKHETPVGRATRFQIPPYVCITYKLAKTSPSLRILRYLTDILPLAYLTCNFTKCSREPVNLCTTTPSIEEALGCLNCVRPVRGPCRGPRRVLIHRSSLQRPRL